MSVSSKRSSCRVKKETSGEFGSNQCCRKGEEGQSGSLSPEGLRTQNHLPQQSFHPNVESIQLFRGNRDSAARREVPHLKWGTQSCTCDCWCLDISSLVRHGRGRSLPRASIPASGEKSG